MCCCVINVHSNSLTKYNENYYKNIITFAEGIGIDMSPSGVMVLTAYMV